MKKLLALPFVLSLCAVHAAAAGQELGLEDAVAAALALQPRLRAAESEVHAAEARVRLAELNRMGTLETHALYTPTQRPLSVAFPGIDGVLPPTTFEVRQLGQYAFNATLSQPLFTWGALSSQREAARRDLGATRSSYERAQQQLRLEASEAFLLAATGVAAIAVREEALVQQQAFLRATHSRMEAGSSARLDVLKAQLSVSEAESALLTARNRSTLAREALATVTGDTRFRTAALRDPGEGSPEPPTETDAIARALQARPDLVSLRGTSEALSLRTKALQAASLPSLGLRAGLTQQSDEASQVFSRSGQIYQLSLALSWDPTESVRSRPRIAELRARQDGLSQTLRAAQDGVALEVRASLSTASDARQQLLLARSALATAEEQARVARLAYAEGVLSALEARDAELGLTGARFALLRARLELAIAQARLRCAIGD